MKLTPTELAEFKRLLALYLALTCVHCESSQVEDRHIVTCSSCGVVLGDLRTVITMPGSRSLQEVGACFPESA